MSIKSLQKVIHIRPTANGHIAMKTYRGKMMTSCLSLTYNQSGEEMALHVLACYVGIPRIRLAARHAGATDHTVDRTVDRPSSVKTSCPSIRSPHFRLPETAPISAHRILLYGIGTRWWSRTMSIAGECSFEARRHLFATNRWNDPAQLLVSDTLANLWLTLMTCMCMSVSTLLVA